MSDDKSKTVADRKRINVHEVHELRYWSKKFGVSHDQLKAAVRRVGVMADDVARELGKVLAAFNCTTGRHRIRRHGGVAVAIAIVAPQQ